MVEAAEEIGFLSVRVKTAVLRDIEMKKVEDTHSRLKNGAKLRQKTRHNRETRCNY